MAKISAPNIESTVTIQFQGQDIATRDYVDTFVQGLKTKGACRAATTGSDLGYSFNAGVLTAGGVGAIVVDGESLVADDRVLVKDQTLPQENGIYYVSTEGDGGTTGVLTRAPDMDADTEVSGAYCFVTAGTVNEGRAYVATFSGTLNSASITWTRFTDVVAYTAGDGLTGSSTFAVQASDSSISVGAGGISLNTANPTSFTSTFEANGATFSTNNATSATLKAANVNLNVGDGDGTTNVGHPNNTVNVDGTVLVNDSVNQATSVNTGTSTGTVTIGNDANAGALQLRSSASVNLQTTSSGALNLGNSGSTVTVAGPTSVNASVNQNTSINTGTSTGTVTLGNDANAGAVQVRSSDSVNLQTTSSGTLNLGNTNSTVTLAGPTNVNASVNQNTNINTGTSTGTVTIGNAAATVAVVGATTINASNNDNTLINTGSSTGTVTIGNKANSGDTTIESGGNVSLQSDTAVAINNGSTGNVSIGNATGTTFVNGSTLEIARTAGNIEVGDNGSTGTLTVGSDTFGNINVKGNNLFFNASASSGFSSLGNTSNNTVVAGDLIRVDAGSVVRNNIPYWTLSTGNTAADEIVYHQAQSTTTTDATATNVDVIAGLANANDTFHYDVRVVGRNPTAAWNTKVTQEVGLWRAGATLASGITLQDASENGGSTYSVTYSNSGNNFRVTLTPTGASGTTTWTVYAIMTRVD